LDKVELPFPPHEEQTAIAAFLDRETAKIDALIAEQEKLIALLAEKRQATISHAVTRGLNPDAPMKDSGVAWLGEVPAHWEIAKIKRFCQRITDGAHISPETEGGQYCFVSTKDVLGEDIDFEGCLLTSPASYEYMLKTGCRPVQGDVLFSKDGTIGRTVVVRNNRDFVVASSLIIISPTAELLDSDFLNYLCKSSVVSRQVDGFVKGAGLPRLSIQNLLRVLGIFPPLEEQSSIAMYLGAETEKLDSLKGAAERVISLLSERRSALIAAAVTGQIDVRCAMPQPAQQEELAA
jgi:type I restriction enzyme S subunit